MTKGGGVTPHPSVKASPPRKPPCDREGQGKRMSGEAAPYGAKREFDGYEHSPELHYNDYGHDMSLRHKPTHMSEVEGANVHSYPKAGDQKADDEPG
jgi:hypothetical protein